MRRSESPGAPTGACARGRVGPSSTRRLAALLWAAAALAVAAPAGAAVPAGSYCVVGLGAATDGTTDGWLRIVSPAGAVTALTFTPALSLVDPWDCAIDPTNGDVVIVDEGANGGATDGVVYRIVVDGTAGAVTTVASGAPFVNPRGVTVDGSGVIYVADIGAGFGTGGSSGSDGAVYSIDTGGAVTRLDTAGVTQGNPVDLDVDPHPFTGTSAGTNLVILDRTGRIDRVPLGGGTVVTVSGAPGGGNNWEGLEVGPLGKYFLADHDNDSIVRFDRDTGTRTTIATLGGTQPEGITVDYFTGDLVWPDFQNDNLRNTPPNAYLGGAPGTTTVASFGGALQQPAGVGFAPPLPTALPSANFGVPTRRAPASTPFALAGPDLAIANGEVEFEVDLFIEVTDTSDPLLIRIFDANSRDGYDEPRGGGFDSGTTLALTDPSGATVTSVTIAANTRVDLDQRIATLNSGNTLTVGGAGVTLTTTGLHRLRITMDDDDDLNEVGVWVDRFHAYTYNAPFGPLDTFATAPTPRPTTLDPATLYPYVDRGCEYTVSNYDMDLAAGTSLTATSRLGESFGLTLSGITTHAEVGVDPAPGGGARASQELDFGLHRIDTVIAPTKFGDNNVVTLRVADFQGWSDAGGAGPPVPVPPGNAAANPTASLRTSPGPAFPQTLGATSNTFLRMYLPRYEEVPGSVPWAGTARPYAPYAMHSVTPLLVPAPAVGVLSTWAVTVTVVNPDPVNAMTNVVVTAPVPAPAQYVTSGPNVSGGATATGGGVVTTCSAPCSGNVGVTWASIAPGSAETFSYAVAITPTLAGETIFLTGGPAFRGGGATPAANAAPTPGTGVTFTPAWSGAGGAARTESLGPLCDLSVVEGTATPVAVELARFEAVAGDGEVLVVWETASEFENLGFRLYRRLDGKADYELVTPELVLGQGSSEFTARYAFHDTGVPNGVTASYLLEDIAYDGDTDLHGPVSATPEAGAAPLAFDPLDFDAFAAAGGAPAEPPDPGAGDPDGVGGDPVLAGGSGSSSGATEPDAANAPSAGLVILERGASHVVAEVTVPPVETSQVEVDGTLWTRVEAAGYGSTVQTGLPALPAATFWIEGPDASRFVVSTLERDGEARDIEAPVLPVAPPTPPGETAGAPSPDPEVYWSADAYPTQAALVAGSVTTPQGGRLVALRVQPARVHSALGRLEVDTRLRLRIDFEGPLSSASAAEASGPGSPNALAVAASPGVKLAARGRGLVAASGAELVAAGLDPGVDPRRLHVYLDGEPVAVRLEGEQDGVLDAADRLLLYADGREDRYDDREVFFVLPADTAGLRATAVAAAPAGPAVPAIAAATGHFEQQKSYLPGILNGEGDNFVGAFVFSQPVTSAVPTPGLVAAPAALRVRLRGGTTWPDLPDDHRFRVRVEGVPVLDAVFDGSGLFEASAALPAGLLTGDTASVVVEPTFESGAPFDLVYVDALELDYRRESTLRLADGGQLVFATEQAGATRVGGLADAAAAEVWDVSDAALPRRLEGVAVEADAVLFHAEAGARYAVADGGALGAPASLVWNEPSDWADPEAAHGATWLAITHASLREGTEALAALRADQGHSVAVVDVEDVFDELAGGRVSPPALRALLRHAAVHWDPAPRYVVLVGDASYDYRRFLGGAAPNLVPTMLVDTSFVEAASDGYFARLDDDEAPDLAVGRLPVRTPAALEALVDKLAAYDAAAAAAPADDWRMRLLLMADDGLGSGNPVESEAFAGVLDVFQEKAAPGFTTTRVELVDLPDASAGPDANAAIRAGLAHGAVLGVYGGHGGARLWADERIFGASDFDTLANARWPLLVTLNCLTGFFSAPSEESLGEVALEAPDRGAVGVVASTTVSGMAGQDAFADALAERILSGNVRPLGDAMHQALQSIAAVPGAEDVLRSFVLLGDPATSLAMPRVPVADAGADAAATAGALLELDGSASVHPSGGALEFAWQVADGPQGGDWMLAPGSDPAHPRFLASVPGVYTVELVVSAEGVASAPDRVLISVSAPAGFAGCSRTPQPSSLATLDWLVIALPLIVSAPLGRRLRRTAS